jgi:thioredoxin 1
MSNQVQNVVTSTFDSEVLQSQKPVLVDFYADWCGPCRNIAPIVEELAGQYEDRLEVRKVDVDDNAELAAQFGIRSIPTLIVFNQGTPADRIVGAVSGDQLREAIDRNVG